MSRSTEDLTLVVGLDIGTTFSGLAFQLQKAGAPMGELHEVRSWPCPPGYAKEMDQVKVPTKLDYSTVFNTVTDTAISNEDWCAEDDQDREPLWGYLVTDDNKNTIEWPKLLLVDEEDLPGHIQRSPKLQDARRRIDRMGKTPTAVIADYIKQLWKHAFGDEDNEGYIDRYLLPPLKAAQMKTHVVVTIPAIWKNNAVQAMKASLSASILGSEQISFEFISEPEAGMMSLSSQIKNQMDNGDIAVCLDLGGGTADCISYRLTNNEPLVWEEVVPGDGGLCGAIFLDARFEKLFSKVLGSFNHLATSSGWKALLRTEWEHSIKRDFEFSNTATNQSRIISLSTITDHSVLIHDDQLREDVFDPVTSQILQLADLQVQEVKRATNGRAPKTIVLVGGFGQCPYVRGALKNKFSGSVHSGHGRKRARMAVDSGIHILSDTSSIPWAAICRGAVLSNLRNNTRVGSRKARFSFGFVQSVVVAPEDPRGKWHSLFGCHVIPNAMTWILQRGDSISSSDKVLQQTLAFPMSQTRDPYHEATFYAHPDEEPPSNFDRRNQEFQDWGTISIHVPISLDQLPLREDDIGGQSRVFDYDLHINSKGESINVVAFSAETGAKVGELLLKDVA